MNTEQAISWMTQPGIQARINDPHTKEALDRLLAVAGRADRMNKGIVPKYHKGKSINDWYTCGQCGSMLNKGASDDVLNDFCWKCGYRIKWDSCRCLTGKRGDNEKDTSDT